MSPLFGEIRKPEEPRCKSCGRALASFRIPHDSAACAKARTETRTISTVSSQARHGGSTYGLPPPVGATPAARPSDARGPIEPALSEVPREDKWLAATVPE